MAYNNTISILISAKDEASAVLKAATKSVEDSGSQMAAFGKTASDVGGTLTKAVTLPIVGIAVAAVKMAGDFDASMTRLVTSAGESEANLAQVSAGVLKIATDTGTSTTQLAQAMYIVESGGQHGAAGLEVLKAAAQGAKTENADLATVADAVTSAMTDYHLPASQAADVTSKLVAATGQGKTTFQDLAGAMSAILPKASAAGISLNEILGDLASMTLHGISAQQASENLADAVSHLQSPTQAMSKEMAALGLNSTNLSQNLGSVGLTGTIQKIAHAIQSDMGSQSTAVILNMQNALKGLPQAVQSVSQGVINGTASWTDWNKATKNLPVTQRAQAQAFATLYNGMHTIGTEQMSGAQVMQTYAGAMNKAMGDSAGLNVALMLTGENTKNTTGAIQAVSGATADASGNVQGWADIQQTFNYKMAQFKEVLQTSAITLGNDLIPPLETLVTDVTNAAKWFENLNPAQRKFLEQTAGIVAVIGPAVLITGRFASAISSVSGLLKGASGAMGLFSTKKVVTESRNAIGVLGRVGGLAGAAEEAGGALGAGGTLLAALGPVGIGLGVFAVAAGGAYLWVKHLHDESNNSANDLKQNTNPQVAAYQKLASDLGVTLTKTGSSVNLVTLAQVHQSDSAALVKAAQDKVKQSTDLYTSSQNILVTAHGNVVTAQGNVQTALKQFGDKSPQYQKAVDDLAGSQNNYDQKLASTAGDMLSVITNGGLLTAAEAAWAGSKANLGSLQDYLNGKLSDGVGVIKNFGPAATGDVAPIDTLQQHIGNVVSSWDTAHGKIQTQNTLDHQVFQGMDTSIATTQGQTDILNQSLGAAATTVGQLQNGGVSLQSTQSGEIHLSVNAGGGQNYSGSLQVTPHALGTNFAPGGMSLVGENGPELVNLPRGSQVTPAKQTQKQLAAGGGTTNVLSGTFHFHTQEAVNSFFTRLDSTARLAKLGMS